MSNKVQLAVLISTISSKVDGSIVVKLESRELSATDAAVLFGLRGKEAWAVLATQELSERDIPSAPVDTELQTKTPSQRLRSRLFVYHQQVLHGNPGDFDAWYGKTLDAIGQRYLDKIPEEGAL